MASSQELAVQVQGRKNAVQQPRKQLASVALRREMANIEKERAKKGAKIAKPNKANTGVGKSYSKYQMNTQVYVKYDIGGKLEEFPGKVVGKLEGNLRQVEFADSVEILDLAKLESTGYAQHKQRGDEQTLC